MQQTMEQQLAVLFERLDHISRGVDELRPLATGMSTLARDQEYAADQIKHLNTVAEMRGHALHSIDKRVVVLERWHKFMVGMSAIMLTVSLTALGYAKSFVDSVDDFKNDTKDRISAIEFIINSPNFERAMDRDRPVAEGSK